MSPKSLCGGFSGQLQPILLALLIVVAVAPARGQTVIYVDDDASTNGDGISWNTAYKYLQDALADAATNGAPTEIRVAQGTYKPDKDEAGQVTPGDRTPTFQLISSLALNGGYAGIGAPDPDLRDVDSNASILSGDLAGNDVSGDFPNGSSYSENSYHVVTGSSTDATAVLDGFTITGGNADGSSSGPHNYGGGMYNNAGSPTLTNCTFSENSASHDGVGGAMYNKDSNPTLTSCTFSGNRAGHDYRSGSGGGMYNDNSNPALTDCTFSGNTAAGGGGMTNGSSSPTLTNCTFTENQASFYSGGGAYNRSSSPTLSNCIFSGNSAYYGGGMANQWYSSPTLTSCTLTENMAWYSGGGIYNHDSDSSSTLTNCLLWGNTAGSGAQINDYATVSYSDVEGA